MPASRSLARPARALDHAAVPDDRHLAPLLAAAAAAPPAPVAVAWPLSPDALAAPLEAAALGLIEPILIGPSAGIRALARERKLRLGRHRVVEAGDPQAAAAAAVGRARRGAGPGRL
jgi:hypothetical protein